MGRIISGHWLSSGLCFDQSGNQIEYSRIQSPRINLTNQKLPLSLSHLASAANSAAGQLREAGHGVHEPKRQLQPQVRPPRSQRARTKLRAKPAALFGRARSGRPNGWHQPQRRVRQTVPLDKFTSKRCADTTQRRQALSAACRVSHADQLGLPSIVITETVLTLFFLYTTAKKSINPIGRKRLPNSVISLSHSAAGVGCESLKSNLTNGNSIQ